MNEAFNATGSESEAVVRSFIRAMEEKDHSLVADLLAPNLRYKNVSLPTLKGGKFVADVFRKVLVKGVYLTLHVHDIAVNGGTVMTERTDVLKIGPFHVRFWVFGTFRVEDGKIVLWRDYFDWLNITCGVIDGIISIPFAKRRKRPLSIP